MPLKIVRNDIVRMKTQAIVNTANREPVIGEGCDAAVYAAAGREQLLNYRKEKIGSVPEGEVFLTPGFDLTAEYIIHAVSPLYVREDKKAEKLLRNCYRKIMKLCKERSITSVSIPLISTGSYGYPKEEGMRIALDEISAFLLKNELMIYLVVFDEQAVKLSERITPELEKYIDRYYTEEAEKREYSCDISDGSVRKAKFSLTNAFFLRDERPRFGNSSKSSMDSASKELSAQERENCAEIPLNQEYISEDNDLFVCEEALASPLSAQPFEEEHEGKLAERIRHLSDTFSEYLFYLIREKGLENAEVWKRALVDKKTFSKIKNHKDYHPQKLTALCLCVGARLNLDETRTLLGRAGYALSPCDKTDIIFSYFIENEIYDMIELDIQLEEHGLPCIIE